MALDWQVFCKETTTGDLVEGCFGRGVDQTYLNWILSAWGWTLTVALLALCVALFFGLIVGTLRTLPSHPWLVRLGNGHREVHRVCDVLRVVPVARELAGDLRDHPFVAPEAVTETGLPSYGWWKGVGLATANEARRWVRWRLLKLPAMTDAEADRFIASLDPPKREDLLRRAKDGKGVAGF
jgi:hypothetical protein